MSSAIEKKKNQRRRNKIHLNFSYCGCVSGSHLSTAQADKTNVIRHEGSSTAAKTQEHLHQILELGGERVNKEG